MEQKHHFRKVYKSDHLGIADLEDYIEEGKKLIFTIKEVKQHNIIPNVKGTGVLVAGKLISANIAYFAEPIKPMVLNATNAKQIKAFTGSSFVEDWKNVLIELYCDESVKMKGEVVGGIRIKPVQPISKAKTAFTKANFEAAKKANATIEMIEKAYTITDEVKKEYLDYVTTK